MQVRFRPVAAFIRCPSLPHRPESSEQLTMADHGLIVNVRPRHDPRSIK